MSEMIERIAKALVDSWPVSDLKWDQQPEFGKDKARKPAKAAIEAMREPTDKQILAGARATAEQLFCQEGAWDRGHWSDAAKKDYLNSSKCCWRAMIDAALKETK